MPRKERYNKKGRDNLISKSMEIHHDMFVINEFEWNEACVHVGCFYHLENMRYKCLYK